MGNTTNLNVRVNEDLKRQAESIFNELGMNLSTAMNLFLRSAVRCGGIPFDLRLPKKPRSFGEISEDDGFYDEANISWLERSLEHAKQGKVIIKTMEELERMADE